MIGWGFEWGGVRRVDLSFCVSLVLQYSGSQDTQMLGKKQHEKCHCHAPFCVPQSASKN